MRFLKRLILYPLAGGLLGHLAGACVSGLMLMFFHYRENFNAHPELIQEYWTQLVMAGQLPALAGIMFGLVAVFVGGD